MKICTAMRCNSFIIWFKKMQELQFFYERLELWEAYSLHILTEKMHEFQVFDRNL